MERSSKSHWGSNLTRSNGCLAVSKNVIRENGVPRRPLQKRAHPSGQSEEGIGIWVAVWLSAPVCGYVYVGGVEGGDGGAAEEAEGAFNVGAEDFEGAEGAGIAGRGHAVGVSAADEDTAGAEADGFDDVTAAANAAIHQHFGAAVDGGDDFRKRADGGIDGIELAATMIGDNDCCGAFIRGAARVVSREQAFHDDWAGPDFSNPDQVVPGDGGVGEGEPALELARALVVVRL